MLRPCHSAIFMNCPIRLSSARFARRGNAGFTLLVAIVVCAIGYATYVWWSGRHASNHKVARSPEFPVETEITPPTALPAPPPVSSPEPETRPEPAPAEVRVDAATIAATPAWWPKTVSLTQATTIPVMLNGQAVGRAQLPARTSVKLIRFTGAQLEIEHLNQRLTVPAASTDFMEQATALARNSPATPETIAPLTPRPVAAVRMTPNPKPAIPQSPPVGASKPVAPTSDHYQKLASEVMADIQQKFWVRPAKRYAKKAGGTDPDTVWGAGVMFSAVVGAARHEPGRYRAVLQDFFEGLNGYWDSKAKVPGYEPAPTSGNGHDKYYDDNAWMVITFFEAYELTHSPRYRKRAEETLDFVLSGWDDTLGGGIWWHEAHAEKAKGKNTCANAPSAVGCLLAAHYSQGQAAKQQLEWAEKIIPWTVKNLQLDNALFADSIGLDGKQNRGQLTYNSALMLRAFLGLYRATKKPEYLQEAQRIGKAADSFLDRETGAYRDPVKWAHLMVEADLELYRTTHEEYLLARAAKNADHYYQTWKTSPPDDLISAGSIARTLWLMADSESEVGRKFWAASDTGKTR